MLLDVFLKRLIRRGVLSVRHHDGRVVRFGEPDPALNDVAIRFTDAGAAAAIARNPRLGAGEAYMDARLVIEAGDVLDLVRLIRANQPWEKGGRLEPRGWLRDTAARASGRIDRLNWERRSRRNVAHHYDLDDRLYALFLDPRRQYSCAYFTSPDLSLEAAQEAKLAHIAAKLALRPGQRVLDIGCGWGGLALYLHEKLGVEVLGITLSREQLGYAREQAQRAGVSDKVRFELIDYRAVTGSFDRIVSVGMFEHVGPPHYDEFFRACRNLLEPEGVMLLHTIGRMGGPGTTDAFTRKYIFPGGYIPALSEIVTSSQRARLIATDIETLRLHYALTLRHWYDRVAANATAIEALYDARFLRLWQFYLAGALISFEFGGMVNYQLQFTRSRHALPITRDYLQEAEAALR